MRKKVFYSAVLVCGLSVSSIFASDVLVKVNGNDITKDDVNAFIKANQPVGLDLTYDKLKKENKRQIVSGLIDNELMVEAAKKANIEDSPELKKELENVKKALMIKYWLKKQFDNVVISDSEIKELYKKYKKTPEEVHARHILVKDKAEAQKIIHQLKKLSGKALKSKFISLAKSKSIGPSGKNGGDLGYFKKDDMVPEFASAAFSIKKGHISKEPVKTQFGWHVIYVEDHKASKEIPLEKVKDKIVQDLKQKHFKDKVAKDLEIMRKKADIKIVDKILSGIAPKKSASSKPAPKKVETKEAK